MADNRYNVDDILRELSSGKSGQSQGRPAPGGDPRQGQPQQRPTQQPQPARRPAPPQEDQGQWAPVGRAPRPVSQQPSRPTREIPRVPSEGPRLGQTIQKPRSPEEMGRLLDHFDDHKEDPLGNLDFLEERQSVEYGGGPARDFTPSWDRAPQQPAQPQQPRRQEPPRAAAPVQAPPPRRQASPAPQEDFWGQPPQGRVERPSTPQPQPSRPMEQPPAPRPALQQQGRPAPGQPSRYYGGSRMQQNDRREMAAKAARMITGGMDTMEEMEQSIVEAARPAPRPQQPTGRMPRPAAPQPTASFARPTSREVNDQLADPMQVARPRPQMNAPAASAPAEELPREEEAPRREKRGGQSRRYVAEQLNGMRTSLLVRILVNVLTLCGVIYLVMGYSYDLPLPGFLSGSEQVGLLLWCGVLLVAVSAVVSGNTIGSGILALCKLRPSNDSYTALAVFACTLQGAYLAMQPQLMADYGAMLYLPVAAMMLLFNTLGKFIMLSRMSSSFGLLATPGAKGCGGMMESREFAKRITGEILRDEPRVAWFGMAGTADNFLDQAFSESRAEDISKIVAPMTALAALVMALVSYLFNKDIFISACVFTAALCITSPLAGVIASQLPLSITNGKLARWGASLCGYQAVTEMAGTNAVLMTAGQLFPRGSVTLQNIQPLDRRPIDQSIVDAASVIAGCDSPLNSVFADMIQDSSMLYEPENLEYIDGMGISAWVNGRRVLLGNRNLMASYGVAVPDPQTERQYGAGRCELLYLANSGEISALFLLNYKADKNMRRGLEMLCDNDIGVCLYSNDQCLTEEKLSEWFGFPRELLTIIPATMHPGAERYLRERPIAEAGVIHNGTPASFLRTILAARACSRTILLEMALILMSVVVGFGIVTILAFTQQMESMTWITLTVFQCFWLIIQLVVPLFKN